MSTLVDERIVKIEFDNKNFEKNVRESIDTVEDLRESMDFDGVARSINGAFSDIDSTPVIKVLDKVEAKISALDIAFVTFISRITNQIMDLGEKLVKSLSTDQIESGWSKLEKRTIAVGTLVSQGNDIEVVEEQLEKLNYYADQTSYNFTDMVDNISKFTAAGKGLEESVEAMMGIANWAAMAGQGADKASGAMFQLSQAMGRGMRREDWRSIQTANMDTEQFRQTAMDTAVAMGKLNKSLDGVYTTLEGTEFTTSTMVETLAEGWMDPDVMVATFKKYSAAVDDIYAYQKEHEDMTANQVIAHFETELDALKVQTEEIEALADEKIKMAKTDEEIAEAEQLITEAEAKRAEVERREFGLAALKAAQETRTLSQAIQATKDAVSSGWMNTFSAIFGDYTEQKKIWSNLSDELWDIFAAGGESRVKIFRKWADMGGRDDLFSLDPDNLGAFWNLLEAIKTIINTVKQGFREVFGISDDAGEAIEQSASLIKSITKAIQNFSKKLILTEKTANNVKSVVKVIASAVKVLIDLLRSAFIIATPFLKLAIKIASALFTVLSKLLNVISKILGTSGGLVPISKKIASVIDKIFNSFSRLTFVKDLFVTINDTLLDLFKNIKGLFSPVTSTIETFTDKIKNSISKFDLFGNVLEKSTVAKSFVKGLFKSKKATADLTEEVENYQDTVSSGFDNILNGVQEISSEKLNLGFMAAVKPEVNNQQLNDIVEKVEAKGGSLRLLDWRTLQATNNDTQELRQTILDTAASMGKLEKQADGTYKTINGTEVSIENLSSTLSEGWLEADIFTESINAYNDSLEQTETSTKRNVTVIDKLKKALSTFAYYLLHPIEMIKDLTKLLKGTFIKVITNPIGVIKNIGNTLKNVLVKSIDLTILSINNLVKTIGNASVKIVKYFDSKIPGFADAFKTFAKGLKNLAKIIGRTLLSSVRAIARVIKMVTPTLGIMFNYIKKIFAVVVKNVSGNVFKTLAKVLGAIAYVIGKTVGAIISGFKSLKRTKIVSTIVKAVKDILVTFKPLEYFFKALKAAFQVIAIYIKQMMPIFKAIGKALKKLIDNILQGINDVFTGKKAGISIKEIISGAFWTMVGASTVVGVYRLVDTLLSLVNPFRSLFDGFYEIASAKKWKALASFFMSLAKSILLISVSLAILGSIPKENLEQGLAALTSIMSLMTIFMTAILGMVAVVAKVSGGISKGSSTISLFGKKVLGMQNQMQGISSTLYAVSKLLMSMGIAIFLITISVEKLGKMEVSELAKGLGVIAALMAGMLYFSVVVSQFKKEDLQDVAKVMMSFAKALLLLIVPIKILGDMDSDSLNQGLLAVGAIAIVFTAMLSLLGFIDTKAQIFGKKNNKVTDVFDQIARAITKLSISLVIMSVAFRIMDGISWASWGQSLIAFTVLIGLITGMYEIINHTKYSEDTAKKMQTITKTILAVSIAMLAISYSIKMLDSVSTKAMMRYAIVFTSLIGIVLIANAFMAYLERSGFLKKSERAQKDIIKIGKSLLMISASMALLGLSILLMAEGFKVLDSVDTSSILIGLGIMIAILAVITLVGYVLSEAKVGTQTALTMMGLAAAMVIVGIAMNTMAIGLSKLADVKLADMIKALLEFVIVATIMAVLATVLTPVIPLLVGLAVAIFLIAATLAIGSMLLNSAATVGAKALIEYCDMMIEVIPHFIEVIESFIKELLASVTRMIPEVVATVITLGYQILAAIYEHIESITEKIVDIIIKFVDYMTTRIPELTRSLVDFLVKLVVSVAENLSRVRSTLINAGIDFIMGTLYDMLDGMLRLRRELTAFVCDYIIAIIDPRNLNMDIVRDKFKEFGKSLWKSFINSSFVQGFKSNKVIKKILEIGKKVSNALTSVLGPVKDWITKYFTFLGNIYKKIFNGLKSAYEFIESIPDKIKNSFQKIKNAIKEWVFDKVVKPLVKRVNSIISGINKVLPKKWEIPKIDIDFSALDEEFEEEVEQTAENMGNALDNALNNIINDDKISEHLDNLVWANKAHSKGVAKALTKAIIDDMVDELEDYLDEDTAKNIGEQLIAGIESGAIDATNKSSVYEYIAKYIDEETRKAMGIESPSRMMMPIGEYLVKGIGVGLEETQLLDSPIENLADGIETDAKSKLKAAFDNVALLAKSLLGSEELDESITIKPVIDMSNIEQGASSIASLFGSSNYSIGTTMALADSVSARMNAQSAVNNVPATQQTSNNETTNVYSTININGTGMNAREIANEVSRVIQHDIGRRKMNNGVDKI